MNEIGKIMVLEQYLRMLSPERQVWIREHNPVMAVEAADLAVVFVAARRKKQPWSFTGWKSTKDHKRPDVSGSTQGVDSTRGRAPVKEQPTVVNSFSKSSKRLIGYLCGEDIDTGSDQTLVHETVHSSPQCVYD